MKDSKRKTYLPKEKVLILKQHLLENKPISDLCDQYGIHPTMFNRWKKQFFENGFKAFVNTKAETSGWEKKIQFFQEKLVRKNEVLSELMEEHVNLKKNCGVI